MANTNSSQWVVVSEYYGEEQSICQVSEVYDAREAAEARAEEIRSWGRSNEVEVRRLADCIACGIE